MEQRNPRTGNFWFYIYKTKQQNLHTTLADILTSPFALLPDFTSMPLWPANGCESEDSLRGTESGLWIGTGFDRDSSNCLVLGQWPPELPEWRLVPSWCGWRLAWPADGGWASRSRSRTTSCGISFGPLLSPSLDIPALGTCKWCDVRCSRRALWGPSCVLGWWPPERNFSLVLSPWCDFGCALTSILDDPTELACVTGFLVFAAIKHIWQSRYWYLNTMGETAA